MKEADIGKGGPHPGVDISQCSQCLAKVIFDKRIVSTIEFHPKRMGRAKFFFEIVGWRTKPILRALVAPKLRKAQECDKAQDFSFQIKYADPPCHWEKRIV